MASPSVTAFAPGRVNLIGEHTDYNDGLALPFAIDAGVRVRAVRSARPGWYSARALDLGKSDVFALAEPQPDTASGWRSFVRGTVAELSRAGVALEGAELTISGNLPQGRGLSSSAALEVSLCLALLAVSERPQPDEITLARLCSRVENAWVGAESGLLDQLAVICATPGHALAIDFATLEMRSVPLVLDDHQLVMVDSRQAHHLASSGYNERRAECRRACALLGVMSLRQAPAGAWTELPEPLNRRVRHVITENDRVREGIAALGDRDLDRLGALLNASHASLRDDYASSTPEVEATVARVLEHGAIGARMVGGGFGGGVIALFAPGSAPPPDALVLSAAGGARLLDPDVDLLGAG